jgi:hypothetical protein
MSLRYCRKAFNKKRTKEQREKNGNKNSKQIEYKLFPFSEKNRFYIFFSLSVLVETYNLLKLKESSKRCAPCLFLFLYENSKILEFFNCILSSNAFQPSFWATLTRTDITEVLVLVYPLPFM